MFKIVTDEKEFNDCIFVTGFHGIGATGYWTIRFLVRELKAKRIGFIDTTYSAPFISLYNGKLITPFEFYKWRNMVFFKAEAPPYGVSEVKFFRRLGNWVLRSGFKEAVLIGGLDINLKVDLTDYRYASTSTFNPYGELVEAQKLEDEQVIVGPVAILLNYFEVKRFPAYAILAYSSTDRVDPRAAATAVSLLKKLYKFEVDITPLIKGAEAIESELARREAIGARKGGESIYT
jgi:predicted ATP-grasp superfamily ATP-dependent carboligase